MNDLIIITLKNIGTFSITIFSVEMTVFTVIYSFIISKRGYFKAIAREAKLQKETSTYLETEKKFAIEYMNKLIVLNKKVIFLAIASLLLYFISLFICLDFEKGISYPQYAIGTLSLLYVVGTLYILVNYLLQYRKEIKY